MISIIMGSSSKSYGMCRVVLILVMISLFVYSVVQFGNRAENVAVERILEPDTHQAPNLKIGTIGCVPETLVPILGSDDIKDLAVNDTRLLNYLRSRHLTPPSKLPYNFAEARYAPGGNLEAIESIKKIIRGKRNGFFVEVGAFDGVGSNTLFLETEFGWSGVLIECHPKLIPELRRAHRKAYIADVCISIDDRPSMSKIISAKEDFKEFPGSNSLIADFFERTKSKQQTFEVQTVPLSSILKALKVKIVDFIVLDVQGIELKVLSNFLFNEILVKGWMVEHSEHSVEDKKEIITIMSQNGYKLYQDLGGDYIFVHSTLGEEDSSVQM